MITYGLTVIFPSLTFPYTQPSDQSDLRTHLSICLKNTAQVQYASYIILTLHYYIDLAGILIRVSCLRAYQLEFVQIGLFVCSNFPGYQQTPLNAKLPVALSLKR